MTSMENRVSNEAKETKELIYEPVPRPEDVKAWLREAYKAGVDHGVEVVLREITS